MSTSGPCFPTPPLVSPKFPRVPLGVGGWRLGSEERRCWANCPCDQFPRFPTYVVLIHQRYRRTDRSTDRRMDTMRSEYHAMHYGASYGKNCGQSLDSPFRAPKPKVVDFGTNRKLYVLPSDPTRKYSTNCGVSPLH